MLKSNLLDAVVHKTVHQTKKPEITVTNTDDVLALATISYEKKKRPEHVSKEVTKRQKLFHETVRDINFFFQQYRLQMTPEGDRQKCKVIWERLMMWLDYIDEEIDTCSDCLCNGLKTNSDKVVAGAAFALSSVNLKNNHSKYLECVFSELLNSDANTKEYLIDGLKHGLHPKIDESLLQLLKTVDSKVQETFIKTLEFRKNSKQIQYSETITI